jgi:ABC-type amino acid transport substrate-binding protein
MVSLRVVVVGALAVLLAALFATVHAETVSAEAQPEPAAVDGPTFYVSQVWPWGYSKNGGRPEGMLADFARRLADVSGVPLQIELRPHRRVIAELADGQSAFVMLFKADVPPDSAIDLGSAAATEILLTNDVLQTDQALSLDSLSGKSIAFINGTSYGLGFDEKEDVKRVPVRDLFQAVELLKKDRVDGFISSGQALYHTLGAMKLPASDFNISKTGRRRVAHLYMDRNSPWTDAAEKLKVGLEKMRKDGELAEIFALPVLTH